MQTLPALSEQYPTAEVWVPTNPAPTNPRPRAAPSRAGRAAGEQSKAHRAGHKWELRVTPPFPPAPSQPWGLQHLDPSPTSGARSAPSRHRERGRETEGSLRTAAWGLCWGPGAESRSPSTAAPAPAPYLPAAPAAVLAPCPAAAERRSRQRSCSASGRAPRSAPGTAPPPTAPGPGRRGAPGVGSTEGRQPQGSAAPAVVARGQPGVSPPRASGEMLHGRDAAGG